MKLALAQMKMSSSMDENFQKSLAFVREAAKIRARRPYTGLRRTELYE